MVEFGVWFEDTLRPLIYLPHIIIAHVFITFHHLDGALAWIQLDCCVLINFTSTIVIV